MKTITIAGRIGKSAEIRRTQDGTPVASFSVAVDDRSTREKSTAWFDVSLFGKRSEAIAEYLTKGTSVAVTGDLGRREHEGKTYLTVRANDVTLMGGGERSEAKQERKSETRQRYDDDPDSIPF